MRIEYNGVNITQFCKVRRCIVRDGSGSSCDSLELELESAQTWDRWRPEADDRIVATLDTYSSGIMYVNTVSMEDGKYWIYATSFPCRAHGRRYASYYGYTLGDIMYQCAAACGMETASYGIDTSVSIPYIEQRDEGSAVFLLRLLEAEGAKLKCINGKLAAVGILYAQGLPVSRKIAVAANQRAAVYTRLGTRARRLTIQSPGLNVFAEDTAAPTDGEQIIFASLPVNGVVQAGRWARGMLLAHNQKAEQIRLNTVFDPLLTSLVRVDVTGGTQADGEWMVEDVEQDLYNRKTMATLRRCIDTIR